MLSDGKFTWHDDEAVIQANSINRDNIECTLSDVNVRFPRGRLTILVGSIGSGKSTLLASLIGETYMVDGEIHWLEENRINFGYVPSMAWILNVSLQDNITFGREFDPKRYDEVVRACCLKADIDLLPQRDQTIIGERGITLSGGQRQRIALARAIYSSAPTLILDDALSALDPIVGYSVFENAIIVSIFFCFDCKIFNEILFYFHTLEISDKTSKTYSNLGYTSTRISFTYRLCCRNGIWYRTKSR